MSQAEIKNIIFETIDEIISESNLSIGKLKVYYNLHADLGFNSLELARLIALLEVRLHEDPFAQSFSITSIKTINDLIEAYQTSAELKATEQMNELTDFQQQVINRRKLTWKLEQPCVM